MPSTDQHTPGAGWPGARPHDPAGPAHDAPVGHDAPVTHDVLVGHDAPVGRDLHGAGRDAGAQDRALSDGGAFGRNGVDATVDRAAERARPPLEHDPAHRGQEPLQGNSAATTCDGCGRALAPRAGYRFFGDEGTRTLCPDCYRERLQSDDGGKSRDIAAHVDGASG